MAGSGGKFLSKFISFLNPISLRRLSTAGIAASNPPPPAHFSVEQYLVHSCGLSKKQAEAVSMSPDLARLRSPDKPDAILRFLRDRGLADDEIAAFVSRRPRLLCVSVRSEVTSKFDILVGIGFSAAEVAVVLQKCNLISVSLSSIKKRVEFLRSILDEDADVKKVIKRAMWTLTGGTVIEGRMVDNIAKLRDWGVSTQRIKALLLSRPRFFQMESVRIDDAASVAEVELGISRHSKIFVHAVVVLSSTRESTRQSKYEVFESFGWNKSDILALFKTSPYCFGLGTASLTKHLEFFMNKVGLSAAYIVNSSSMLGMNLERRIIPRYEFLFALKAKKIPSKKLTSSFCYVARLSEIDFQRNFVNKFMKLEPDACQLYMSRVKSYLDSR